MHVLSSSDFIWFAMRIGQTLMRASGCCQTSFHPLRIKDTGDVGVLQKQLLAKRGCLLKKPFEKYFDYSNVETFN
jgi:hypothetical protein